MSNVIRIGRHDGQDRAVRLKDLMAQSDGLRRAQHLTSMRDRIESAIADTITEHGDGVAKTLMLDVARKFFPGG